MIQLNQPQPATLYGTVFKVYELVSKNEKPYKRINVGLYTGKNSDGTYKPSTFVTVMYWGNKDFILKQKYSFSGQMVIETVTKDDKVYHNATLTCFDNEVEISSTILETDNIPF